MDPALEENLEKVLSGEGLQLTESDFSAAEAVPVTLRRTVGYIVCAVIFNSEEHVLMVQEAKRECRGRWYLPAGRMEPGENIQEALQREVREETGRDCQPITLLLVQEQGLPWIRFVFLAEAAGGALKTPAQADEESLQAQWWDRDAPLPLRSPDILPLVEAGLRFRRKSWFPALQPVELPSAVVCQRLVLVFLCSDREVLLLTAGDAARLPVVLSVRDRLSHAVKRLLQESMPASATEAQICGLLGVQHSGRVPGRSDGVVFNMLVLLQGNPESAPTLESERFRWQRVASQSLREKIVQRIRERSLLPFQSL